MQTLRVGIPGDYSGSRIPATLARFRLRWPDIGFTVTSGPADNMLRELKQGDLDVVMAVTDAPPVTKPRHVWMRQAVWVRSDATKVDPDRPVPLVSYGEDCACQRVAVAALSQAGRRCDFVFTSASLTSLAAAVSAGFGVLVMPRGRALRNNLYIWDDPPLPALPQLFCGIYVRDGEARPPPTNSRTISTPICGPSRSRRTTRPAPRSRRSRRAPAARRLLQWR